MRGELMTTPWQAVLSEHLADRATEIVGEVGDAISFDQPAPGSLASGDSGFALFHAYRARAVAGGGHEDLSRRYLERAVDSLAATKMEPGLHSGFTGIAFAVEHLLPTIGPEEDDLNASIDEALESGLRDSGGTAVWLQSPELIAGLAGLGIYALERMPRPSAVRLLESIVARMAALSRRTTDGITWWTAPELLPPISRERTPEGCYNLGVAHGVPGAIAFLGEVCAAGVAEREAFRLLEGAVSWLLAQRSRLGDAAFPTWIASNGRPPARRVSWCYGNPGIAAALLVAARAVGDRRWEAAAIELALESAAQGIEDSGVIEACLCHGSAGNGHLFNRLFQATGDERLRGAAVAWYARTFELHKPGSGLAGFESLVPQGNGEMAWKGVPGFLNGVAGIGLALLAATTTVEPAWDRVLACSVPARI
jgi:lantibiotic modifying enzyme